MTSTRTDTVDAVTSAGPSLTLRPRPRPVLLGDLFGVVGPEASVPVTGVTANSGLVVPGDLYAALPGRSRHGAEFATTAVGSGAAAILTDPLGADGTADLGCPVVTVPDPRARLGALAARIYGQPAEALTMFGITGTNGKTTTAFLLAAALHAAGRRAGVVGTLGFFLDDHPLPRARTTVTTPEAPELQALLAVFQERGADAAAVEVSSHALVLGRVDGILFDVAAFTNLGQDHLDFHQTAEAYFEAKASLFTAGRARHAVISLDDPRGRQLADRVRAGGQVGLSTVSLTDPAADYRAEVRGVRADGTVDVAARLPGGTVDFSLGMPGDFNVRNALTALAMLDVTGVEVGPAAAGLGVASVPGRMERVPLGTGAPTAYVDFAHTPQAVTAALRAAHGRRRVVVLGCGGDRDPDKRRPMGAAAARGADVVIVTDDNPRFEDPAAIRAEILAGARAVNPTALVLEIADRRAAIRRALELAEVGEAVVVLGKGHEAGQEIGGQVLPFRDVDEVRAQWAARGAGEGGSG